MSGVTSAFCTWCSAPASGLYHECVVLHGEVPAYQERPVRIGTRSSCAKAWSTHWWSPPIRKEEAGPRPELLRAGGAV